MTILTKAEIFKALNDSLTFPASDKRFIVYILDFSDNILSPEKYAYSISYTCSVFNERHNITFWPNSVGIQGKSKVKGMLLK